MRPLIVLVAWLLLSYSSLLPVRSQEVVASISVGQGAGTLVGVAVDPGSNTIFCGAYGGIFALDGSDDSYEYPPSGTWGSYPFATGVAVNPSTGRVYIAESYPPNSFYSLQVRDEATGNNLAGIVLGSNPNALAVNSSANMVYVATATGIVVVDGSTDLQVTTIPVLNATGVAADSTRGKLYAVYQNGATFSLAVVDATSNTVISTVALRSGAYGIAVNPVTNRLYITLSTAGGVQVLEGVGYTEIAYSGTGAEPEAVAVNTVTNTIYIANLAGQTVTILDGSTNLGQYTRSVPSPWAIAVNEATNLIYVAGGNTSTFTVIDGAAVQPASLTFMGDEKLRVIATELVTQIRKNVSIDWTLREGAQAKIRVLVKRILNRFGYPPDMQEAAVK
jgi:DNA-binding beta-propeller fold protein YncE